MNTQLLSAVTLSSVSLGVVTLGVANPLGNGKYITEDVTLLSDDNEELWLDDGDTITMTVRRKA